MECFLRTEKDKMKNKKKFYYIGCFFALLGFYVLLQIKNSNNNIMAPQPAKCSDNIVVPIA